VPTGRRGTSQSIGAAACPFPRASSKHSYTVQSPYQMVAFAPCPFSLSQLVDSRKALVWRNLSVSKRCTFLFPTSRLIRPSISRNQYMKNKSRVQTCPNLGHFSVEQMRPFDTGTELCRCDWRRVFKFKKSNSGEGTCAAAPDAKRTSSGRDSSRSSRLVLEDPCPCFACAGVVLGELGPGIGGWGGQLTRASPRDLRSDGGLGREPPREAQKVYRKVVRFNDASCGEEADWRSTGCVGIDAVALWPPPEARRMRLLEC